MILFEEAEGLPDPGKLSEIKALYRTVFTEIDESEFTKRIKGAESLFTVLAYSNQELIGCKLGYQIDSAIFYSWLGGVKEEFRKQGIGDELMRRQHNWCRKNGFQIIRTKTRNRFKPMLILNLRNEFDVVKVEPDEQNELKIVLEKRL